MTGAPPKPTPKAPAPPSATRAKKGTSDKDSTEIIALRRELDAMRKNVETVLAEKESASRDSIVVGDTLEFANETLRATNDEFRAAQEELQSTNDELTRLNDELRDRNTELGRLADDLDNVIDGVEIPFLVLGPDLVIHRFTPQTLRIINLTPADVGRAVTDLTLKVDIPDFKGAVEEVLRTLEPSEDEVNDFDGHWYSMRIRPYQTRQGTVDGVVVAFVDIDLLKRATQIAETARDHAEAIMGTMRKPLITLSSTLRVMEANRAFYETFGASAEDTVGTHLYELGNGQWDTPELRSLLEAVLPGDNEFADLEVEWNFPGIGRRIMVLGARRVREEHGRPSILLAIDDVTSSRRQARMEATLNEVSLKISTTFDIEDILDEVLEWSAASVTADSGAVVLRQEDAWVVKSVFGMDEHIVGQTLEEDQALLSLLSAERRNPILVPDISKDERFNDSIRALLGEHGVLMVPLFHRRQTFGSISFHVAPGNIFSDVDVDFGMRLGTLLSLAFENARLYAAQRQIADTLQTALLTPPRDIPGIDFGHLYRSATTTASVGGDLYDLFELAGNRVGVLIGDVSGKGVEAATLAGLVKNTIRAFAYDNKSPADIMVKTNDVVFRATSSWVFVTLMFGMLDIASGHLVYCSAGHTRGIVKRSGGEVDMLEVQSPLTGAFQTADFVNGEVVIGPGDALVLYTDGVTEARRDSKMLGEAGLVDFVRSLGTVPTEEIPAAIFGSVLDYTESRLADDVAIISVGLA